MAEEFSCPNCGAPVPLDDSPPATVRCPHCSTAVIVPESLRRRADPSPVVIRIDRARSATTVPPRTVGAVAIAIAAVAILAVGVAAIGIVAGLGASLAPEVLTRSDPARSPLLTFGGEGIGPGRFTDARSIGLDGQGRIYVGDYQGGRIQVFGDDGAFLTQWFADREFPLTGMAVRRDGAVYTVQRGEIVLRDGMTGERIGGLAYEAGDHFEDVALQADGGLVTGWTLFQDDLVTFDRDGNWLSTVPEAVSGQTGDSELSLRVAADGQGDLLVLGEFNNSVFRYDSSGRFVNRFGSPGDEPGQLSAPMSLAVDGRGRVHVGDIWGVEVFDRDGRFLRRIEIDGVPFGLTFDDAGYLWVATGAHVAKYEVAFD
jgi:DNA-directed RNA polymerase subunit RPC12/RpoP